VTLPHERTYAVLNTREQLLNWLASTGRVSRRELRETARMLLKHYPTALDMRNPAKAFEKAGTKWLK
jgi:hypothetical protein